MPRTPIWILPALIVVLATGGGWWLWKSQKQPPLPLPPVETVLPREFAAAMKTGKGAQPVKVAPIKPETSGEVAQYSGNGRERLRVTINNKDAKPYSLDLAAGTEFDSIHSKVVLLAPVKLEVSAGSNKQSDLNCAAVSVTNEIGETAFTKSETPNTRVAPLISLLAKRTDVPFKVAQTAVLALADHAPADVFAKFKRLNSDTSLRYDPIAFKVDNSELVSALSLLREAGVDTNLPLAGDPQVKIETLLDDQSHTSAMTYYGITPEMQWSFWKYELLAGPPSLRHYALYGIARYYPDVALAMLPRWAREKRLDPIYRLSAIRALALTLRPEAIPVLKQLQQDLGSELELAQAAEKASQYLASHQKPL